MKVLLVVTLLICTSCSLYQEHFDTPVYEGVKNCSVTEIERNIVEMPGDQQDVLIEPLEIPNSTCSCDLQNSLKCAKKVWICDQMPCEGVFEAGHYQVFLNGEN